VARDLSAVKVQLEHKVAKVLLVLKAAKEL
jgi:hypothetical protein